MTSVNLACLQTIQDDAMAQRALDCFLAIAIGLDVERVARMVAYRQAVRAGFYTDQVKS